MYCDLRISYHILPYSIPSSFSFLFVLRCSSPFMYSLARVHCACHSICHPSFSKTCRKDHVDKNPWVVHLAKELHPLATISPLSSSPPQMKGKKNKKMIRGETKKKSFLSTSRIQKAERLFSLSATNQLPCLGVLTATTTTTKVYFRFLRANPNYAALCV